MKMRRTRRPRLSNWHQRQHARRRLMRVEGLEPRRMLTDTVSFGPSDMIAGEGAGQNGHFGISRSGNIMQPLTVFYSLSGTATEGIDYQSVPDSVTISSGTNYEKVWINPIDDLLDEPNETVILTIQPGAGYTIAGATQMTLTISDDDLPTSLLSINDKTVVESAGQAVFTVTLSPTSDQQVSVGYATADGTAESGADFTGVTGSLVFQPHESAKTISVPIINDTQDEPQENYSVNLSGPSGAQIADGQGAGYIIDDDEVPQLNIGDAEDWEDLGPLRFKVTLSGSSTATVTVNYFTADGDAIMDVDYEETFGQLTFPPGVTEQYVEVPIIDDTLLEMDEEMFVGLFAPTNASIADGIGTGTILDNEVPPGQVIHCVCYCGCANAETGVTEADGSLQTKDEGGLNNSTSSIPHPLLTIDTQLSDAAAGALRVKIELTFGGIVHDPVYYNPTGYQIDETVRFVVQADASSLPTGRYYWELVITEDYATQDDYTRKMTGFDVINNLVDSEFGNRWTHGQFERLAVQSDGAVWVRGDGNLFWFGENEDGSYTRQDGEFGFSTLVQNVDSTFTLTSRDGARRDFTSGGVIVSRTDRFGNETTYTHVDADGDTLVDELATITDPGGRVTTLAYAGGLISTITDFDGRVTTYGHTGSLLTSITRPDPDSAGPLAAPVTAFGYHAGTNLVSQMTNAANKTTSYLYDFARTLTTITNPDQTTREIHAYKVDGLVNTAAGVGTLANPASLFRPHEAEGSITNEMDKTTTFRSGMFGFSTEVVDPLGNQTEYERDEDGLVTRLTGPDPDGAGLQPRPVTQRSYDSRGNVLVEALPDGATRTWTYHSVHNVPTSFVDELGRKTLYTVDAANGNVLSVRHIIGQVDPNGGESDDVTTSFTYTALGTVPGGLVASMTDPLGRRTEWDYNSRGLATRITFAAGTSEEAFVDLEYDGADNLAAEVDELGRRTEALYDKLDRMIELTLADPDGAGPLASPVTTYEFDSMSHLTREVDPLGRETLHEYGAFGNLKKTTLPDHDGNGTATITSLSHDLAGRLVSVTDPLLRVTQFTLDDLGRAVETKLHDPDGAGPLASPEYATELDPYDRVVKEIDALGNATDYLYLDFGKRIEIRQPDPDGGGPAQRPLWVAEHNSAGELTRWTNPRGGVTEYEHDDLGRVTLVVHPDGSETELEYDKASNVRFVTEPGGAVTEYRYNRRNDLVEIVEADPDGAGPLLPPVTTLAVDAAGQVLSETDPLGRVTSNEFDGLGQLVRRTLADPDFGGPLTPAEIEYEHDAAGRLVKVIATDPDPLDSIPAPQTTYGYDLLDNLVSVVESDPDGPGPLAAPVTTYAFSAASELLSQTDPIGRDTTWVLDGLGRPTSVDDELGQTTTYTWDANSNLLTETNELSQVTSHQYDALSRRVRTTDPRLGVTQAVFDGVGNMTRLTDSMGNETTWVYDQLDRVTAEANELGLSRQYVYSEAGDLSRLIDRNGRISEFTHDALHQLTKEEWLGNVVLPSVVVATTTQGRPPVNELQRIILPGPTGGTWTLSYNGNTTQSLPTSASAMQVQSALSSLPGVGFGNVVVSGAGTPASPFEVAFQGTLAGANVPAITGDGTNLLGALQGSVDTQTQGSSPRNEVQGLLFNSGPGRFIVFLGGGDIFVDYESTAQEIDQRLESLWTIGLGNVSVTGEWPAFQVTFGNEMSMQDVDQILVGNGSSGELVKGASAPSDEVQLVTLPLDATGGTFTLTFSGQTTVTIPYNAPAVSVQAALENLGNIGPGDVVVNGSDGGPFSVTFQGSFAGDDVAELVLNTASITGGLIAASTPIQGVSPLDEVQQVFVNNAYIGTFTLSFDGATSGAIAYDASASTVEAALEAMANIDNVSVAGNAGGPYTVTFAGSQAHTDLPEMSGDSKMLRELVQVLTTAFDAAGQVVSAAGPHSEYAFTYDGLGAVTQVDNQGTPGAPRVILDSAYDALSRRTSLSAEIDGVDDLVNSFIYDALSRMTGVRQQGQAGGNAVATKGVDFGYNAIGQFTSIVRFTDLVQSPAPDVATSSFSYDTLGRLDELEHTHSGLLITGYSWQFDGLNRVTQYSSTVDGTSNYQYDTTSQLVSADHSFQADEAHTYDLAGNRTDTGYVTGDNNRLLSDGTFNYTYDGEGNRLTRTRISSDPADDHLVEYEWDYRNRLTGAVFKNNAGTVTKRVELDYDTFDRRIAKRVDSDGSGSFDRAERWVYDGDDVLLDFVDPDGSGPAALALAARYLHGPAVDQVLAQEDVASGEVLWQLADNQGTTRDLVDSDGVVATHLTFEAFGALTAGDATATRYQFTGREWDADLGLYYYRARWYDPEAGRFLSEDPIGFEADDANLSRYVGNDPANFVDPSGHTSWFSEVLASGIGLLNGQAARGMDLDRRIRDQKVERDSHEGGGQFREAQLYGAETAINDASMFAEGCIEFTAAGGSFVGPSAAAKGIAIRAGSATSKAANGATKGKAAKPAGPGAPARPSGRNADQAIPPPKKDLEALAPDLPVAPPKLPPFAPKGKTSGVLRVGTTDTVLVSGRAGPAASLPKPSPGFNAITATHVEGHAAALMRQQCIQEATLYINNPAVCKPCLDSLAHMLPPGSRLTVVLPDGIRRVFIGNGR